MSNTLTIRLPDELMEWIEHRVRVTGRSRASVVKEALATMRRSESRPFMKLAGAIDGPPDLSARKGFGPK